MKSGRFHYAVIRIISILEAFPPLELYGEFVILESEHVLFSDAISAWLSDYL